MKAATTKTLAEKYHVSQRTVQRWLKEGKLDVEGHQTPGGHWRPGREPTLDDLPPEISEAVVMALLAAVAAIVEDLKRREDQE